MTPRILAFSGSLRKDSINHRLVSIAAEGVRQAGGEATIIRLHDYPLPIFNEDQESEYLEVKPLHDLRDLFQGHHGFLIASPEYNGSVSAALKNTIDWLSRREEGQPPLACFRHKVAGLLSASPGHLGGIRGLSSLRGILTHIQVLVLPQQVAVGQGHTNISEEGVVTPDFLHDQVMELGKAVADTARKVHGTD